jgi:hypothetical protein
VEWIRKRYRDTFLLRRETIIVEEIEEAVVVEVEEAAVVEVEVEEAAVEAAVDPTIRKEVVVVEDPTNRIFQISSSSLQPEEN